MWGLYLGHGSVISGASSASFEKEPEVISGSFVNEKNWLKDVLSKSIF